ncbi:nucleolar protein 56-like protein [Cladochytrium replicatum]|nr:nucleolar protein 56-like protein [Cladochytrium replicatum]
MTSLYLIHETASGYSLFQRVEGEEIALDVAQVKDSVSDYMKFAKIMKLVSFSPFKSAMEALTNINDVSEGICNPLLKSFLESSLPKPEKKKSKFQLGCSDKLLAGSIKAELSYDCVAGTELVSELLRGLRLHGEKILKSLKEGDLGKAQLGLGHAYSRAKVKFNVNRVDNMIIQAISLLDQLDKDVNTFSMRIREWYSWHFPELVKIVGDNLMYAQLVEAIQNKAALSEEHLGRLEDITGDSGKAKQILDAARASMGTDISEVDMENILSFSARVISLTHYRKSLHAYLLNKMHSVAPNLSALIGEMVGARLISHAGSLTNLSKYPASTLQILGAEKALFRALKTKGNTPKYGLIFHSSFISRAGQKNKGRISRLLANKCSIASRIDCFSELPTTKFGEVLREQVDERLKFLEDGTTPRANAAVMKEAFEEVQKEISAGGAEEGSPKKRKADADAGENGDSSKDKKKKKKRKSEVEAMEVDTPEEAVEDASAEKKKKKKKTKADEEEAEEPAPVETEKKKKKKKSKAMDVDE